MKLYIVIYIAGLIGGTVGPLPYGIAECESRATELNALPRPNVVTPQGYTAADVLFACEWHATRPENDPKTAQPR